MPMIQILASVNINRNGILIVLIDVPDNFSLIEGHYSQNIHSNVDYLTSCKQELRTMLDSIEEEAKNYQGEALTKYFDYGTKLFVVNTMKDKAMGTFHEPTGVRN